MGKKNKKRHKAAVKQEGVPKPSSDTLFSKYPYWTMFGLLVLVLCVYYAPVLFSNKTLIPPDKIAAMSVRPFINDALSRGVYPLWNPYIFGGMPSFASLTQTPYMEVAGNLLMPLNLLLKKVLPIQDFVPFLLNYILLGGLLFFLLRAKKLSAGVAFWGSLTLVLLPQVVAYSAFGHSSKLTTILMLPLIFMLAEQLLEKRTLLWFSMTALAIGLQFLRFHVQMCYYTQMVLGLYLIFWIVTRWRDSKDVKMLLKGSLLLAGAIVLGLMLSSIVNLSVMEYAPYSIRGGGETGGLGFGTATSWSFPPSELLTYIVPSFMGFGRETYWGPMPFTDFPLYFGIITLLLAGLALIIKRNRTTWFFTIVAVFALMLSFGRHLPILYGPMFKLMPFFNKFRAPKMVQIILEISMVILAAHGLQGLLEWTKENSKKSAEAVKRYLLIFGGVVVAVFLMLVLAKGAYMGWASKAGRFAEAAHEKAVTDGVKALIFFGVSAVLILMRMKDKLGQKALIFFFSSLVLVDFWSVNRNFLEPKPKVQQTNYFSETAAVQYLKKQQQPFRILPLQDQHSPNWYMYFLQQNVLGYQGAKLRDYSDFLDAFGLNNFFAKYLKQQEGGYAWRDKSEMSSQELHAHANFLKLMNVRYILSPYPIPDSSFSVVSSPQRRGENFVLEYTETLPRVYFPKSIVPVQGKEAMLRYLRSMKFDPAEQAVLKEKPDFPISWSENNRAKVVHYDIHDIRIEAEMETQGLMVLSDIYYPAGWKAYVDGKETEIFKTNYVLRSVLLPEGTHTVAFKFMPASFRTGLIVSVSVFLLLLSGAVIGWRIEPREEEQEA